MSRAEFIRVIFIERSLRFVYDTLERLELTKVGLVAFC
jgi:hypothetical protein